MTLYIIGFVEPISQDKLYHDFSDSREIFSIHNFYNVMTNLAFFFVGVAALYKLFVQNSLTIMREAKNSYTFLFVGIALVSLGSGYYHLDPNNETLLWDRLPMTIAFMSLFSIVISEYVHLKTGKKSLFPAIGLGLASVFYWYWGELHAGGDLRFYALIQLLPIITVLVVLTFFSSKFNNSKGYWILFCCYILAKVFEHFDEEIYTYLGVISGHSLKHLVAAIGLYSLVYTFEKRALTANTTT